MSDDTNRKILVTGATGTQGGAVVKQLLARGYRVRALCRDPESPAARALADNGVEVHRGDLDDRASVDAAVAEIHGVFGVQNFWDGFPARKLGAEGELRQGRNLLVAMAFERPTDFIGAQVDLAGDELSMTAIAEAFTRVTGRPTRFAGSPAGLETMTQMDEDLGTLFRVEMYERGFRAFIPSLRALYPGLSTLEAYLRRAGWAGS